MKKLFKKANADWLDFALISVALIAFGGFVYGTIFYFSGGMHGPIGRLIWGQIQRKRPGMVDFQSATPEAELFNNDMVWTGGTEGARIQLEDGAMLKVPSDTLLVLRRFSNTGWDESIDVLRGEAVLELHAKEQKRLVAAAEKSEPAPAPVSSASPSVSPSAAASASASGSPEPKPSYSARAQGYLYPTPGMVFMNVNPNRDHAQIVFSWNEAFGGELTLSKQGDSQASSKVTVKPESRSAPVKVPVKPGTYSWKIEGSGKTLGPNTFEIRPYDAAQLHDIIQKDPNQVVEFLP